MKRTAAERKGIGHKVTVAEASNTPRKNEVRMKVIQKAAKNNPAVVDFERYDGTNWVLYTPGHDERETLLNIL